MATFLVYYELFPEDLKRLFPVQWPDLPVNERYHGSGRFFTVGNGRIGRGIRPNDEMWVFVERTPSERDFAFLLRAKIREIVPPKDPTKDPKFPYRLNYDLQNTDLFDLHSQPNADKLLWNLEIQRSSTLQRDEHLGSSFQGGIRCLELKDTLTLHDYMRTRLNVVQRRRDDFSL